VEKAVEALAPVGGFGVQFQSEKTWARGAPEVLYRREFGASFRQSRNCMRQNVQ
jgi:hypothetical protein